LLKESLFSERTRIFDFAVNVDLYSEGADFGHNKYLHIGAVFTFAVTSKPVFGTDTASYAMGTGALSCE
jgi:hypothetical protein